MINQSIGIHRENRGPSDQVRGRLIQSGLPPAPTLNAPLLTSCILTAGTGNPTFTRATTATFLDWESVLRTAISGETRFVGARRVRNFLDATQGSWPDDNSNVTITTGKSDPNGGTLAIRITANASSAFAARRPTVAASVLTGRDLRCSMYVRRITGTGTLLMYNAGDGATTSDITSTVTTSWQRIATNSQTSAGGGNNYIGIQFGTSGDEVDICFPQIEDVTGASNQAPSEYVSVGVLSAPYHGACVDGVKYFRFQNGNTVASNVVTEATGTLIPLTTTLGYLAEGAGTQLVTPTAAIRDFTGTWGLTNMTAAKTTTGIDGVANSASRLTATGATATALITLAGSTSRTCSCYMKRVTGTGTIKLVQNATKSADLASSINSSTWTLVQLNASTDTSVNGYGIEIGTSGDAIDVDFFQFESGTFATSRMAAAGAARNADVLTYVFAGNASASVGTAYAEIQTEWTTPAGNWNLIAFGTTANEVLNTQTASTQVSIGDGTNTATKTGLLSTATGVRRRASKWSASGLSVSGDGGSPATNASFDGAMDSTAIGIGSATNASRTLNGTIRNARIWTTALSDNQIAALGL